VIHESYCRSSMSVVVERATVNICGIEIVSTCRLAPAWDRCRHVRGYAAWSMMRLTFRRSMLSSRAIARWLRSARCQECTVCSKVGPSASAGGVSCSTGDAPWSCEVSRWCGTVVRRSARISIISSSKEPTNATAARR
jgi:hypothetical protein